MSARPKDVEMPDSWPSVIEYILRNPNGDGQFREVEATLMLYVDQETEINLEPLMNGLTEREKLRLRELASRLKTTSDQK